MTTAGPALAQGSAVVTEEDIDAARERRAAVSRELAETTARYQDAVAEEGQARERVESLASSLAVMERDLALLELEATTIVREMYMEAGTSPLVGLFDASVFVELPMRASYYQLAAARDLQTLSQFEATQISFIDLQVLLDASLAEQASLVAEAAEAAATIEGALAEADSDYREVVSAWERQEEERRRREEEEQRRAEAEAAEAAAAAASAVTPTTVATTTSTTVAAETTTTTTTAPQPPPATTDGRTCPVDGATTFSDTWGAPRSGGRLHKGVDMIAARGTPIVAVETGVVERISTGSIGGLSIYYRGASGDRYYFSHLDAFAAGVGAGAAFDVGARLGDNGSTGNASDSLPHLHFQWAPGGGEWVNPYPLVVELCL
jgi:murein DD-endopeptidase MepM/ murein hydrolase activator NlpD